VLAAQPGDEGEVPELGANQAARTDKTIVKTAIDQCGLV